MTVMYGQPNIPKSVMRFEMKLRIMLDHRRTTGQYHVTPKPAGNVLQFPTNSTQPRKKSRLTSNLYVQACQQLLGPVKNFFFIDTGDEGGEGGRALTPCDLNGYLGELGEIQGYFTNDPAADQQLEGQERQNFEVDVVTLKAAGFEHASVQRPEILAVLGDQLMDAHFPVNYAELAENSDIPKELRQAYADVRGMIEQAKKLAAGSSPSPTLHR